MIHAYRTKMEYAIYVDDSETFHLAQHIQGTKRGIIPTEGSEIALPRLNEAGRHIISTINEMNRHKSNPDEWIRKSQLKGVMVRYSVFEDKSVCYLFVKDENLDLKAGDFFNETLMKGMFIYHSTKKSPAFVQTSLISSIGERDLTEDLNGKHFKFPSDGFFQINIPIVAQFLKDAYVKLSELPEKNRNLLLDLYAGVGTIGIYCGDLFKKVVGVEYFPGSKSYALKNAKSNGLEIDWNQDINITNELGRGLSSKADSKGLNNSRVTTSYDFVEARSEDIQLKDIATKDSVIFLDPPRAGCSPKVISEILEATPEYIFYLSCNPETQERDVNLLSSSYLEIHSKDYDFFPNTDHLERFMILKRNV